MNSLINMDSKQISYVSYDSLSLQMTVHYHTGETRFYPTIAPEEYQSLVHSTNKYDCLIRLIECKHKVAD